MAINFISQGFIYLYGSIDTDLMKENYLLPKGFSCTEEALIYPPGTFLIGRKKAVFKNKMDETERLAFIEFIFSKKGFLFTNISVDITSEEYTIIDDELFSVEEFNLFHATIQEISWRLSEQIFGKSLLEMQLNLELDTDYFKEYCDKYGIIPIGEMTSLSLSTIVTISDKKEWEKIKQIELEKTKGGGSILQNTVAIPNFDNTAISINPDIYILNSTHELIYTNDLLMKSTFNLVTGIKYQRFGLNFLKNSLSLLQKGSIEIRNYYKNPYNTNISWIYIDRALSKLENKFEDYISNCELEFLEIDDPNYINLKSDNFKEKLNVLLEYTTTKSYYFEMKNHTKERLRSLREMVSDKGEKEEKQAYNRIVAIVGLLAIFQIAPSIFPILSLNTYLDNIFRISFLFIFISSLVLIWYATSYNNERKMKIAEDIEHYTKLLREKELIVTNIAYFKNESRQETFKISDEALESTITALQEKFDDVERELKKLDKR